MRLVEDNEGNLTTTPCGVKVIHVMPTSGQTEHDTHFDTPDDPEEHCDSCGQPWRKCRCVEADRYNDEHWEEER